MSKLVSYSVEMVSYSSYLRKTLNLYSFRYFLFPMRIPDLETFDLKARDFCSRKINYPFSAHFLCLFGQIMMEVGICIGERKYLNEYTPY